MQAIVFAVVLSLALGIPAYFYSKKADKRGLFLIFLALFIAADIWLVQTPRMKSAVSEGGKLANLAIIHVGDNKFGVADVVASVAVIATFAALGGVAVALASAIAQFVAYMIGLNIASLSGGLPLPGVVFIVLASIPFILMFKDRWKEMPPSDMLQVKAFCILSAVASLAGVVYAIVV